MYVRHLLFSLSHDMPATSKKNPYITLPHNMNKFKTLEFLFQAVDKAKAMIAEDSNRSFVVDVFDAGSNQKVVIKADEPGNSRYCDEYH